LHGPDDNGDHLSIDESNQRGKNQYKHHEPGVTSGRVGLRVGHGMSIFEGQATASQPLGLFGKASSEKAV